MRLEAEAAEIARLAEEERIRKEQEAEAERLRILEEERKKAEEAE